MEELDLKNPDGVLTFALSDIFSEMEKVNSIISYYLFSKWINSFFYVAPTLKFISFIKSQHSYNC